VGTANGERQTENECSVQVKVHSGKVRSAAIAVATIEAKAG
jgi:hypothetical protein